MTITLYGFKHECFLKAMLKFINIISVRHPVRQIEEAFFIKEIALCAFIGVEGGFDNTFFDYILRVMTGRGLEPSTNKVDTCNGRKPQNNGAAGRKIGGLETSQGLAPRRHSIAAVVILSH